MCPAAAINQLPRECHLKTVSCSRSRPDSLSNQAGEKQWNFFGEGNNVFVSADPVRYRLVQSPIEQLGRTLLAAPARRGLVSCGSELALGIWNGPCPCLFVYIIIPELRSVNRRACLLVHWDEQESVSLPTDDSASSDLPVVADEVCGLQVPTSMQWDELIEVLHFSLRSPQEGMPIRIPSGIGVTYNLSGI